MSVKEPHRQAPADDYLRDFVKWISNCNIITTGKVKPLEFYQVPKTAMNAISDNLLDIAAEIEEKI